MSSTLIQYHVVHTSLTYSLIYLQVPTPTNINFSLICSIPAHVCNGLRIRLTCTRLRKKLCYLEYSVCVYFLLHLVLQLKLKFSKLLRSKPFCSPPVRLCHICITQLVVYHSLHSLLGPESPDWFFSVCRYQGTLFGAVKF